MDKKKGSTIIITLMLLFIFCTFIGSVCIFNTSVNNQIINITNDIENYRILEEKAYSFYISNGFENDFFYVKDNTIYYKNDLNIVFDVFIENNLINIRRRKA